MDKIKKWGGIFFILLLSVAFFSTQAMAAFKWTEYGRKCYKEWTDILGYNSKELVKKMDPAPEIKPGMVITPQNYKNYPGLKKLLPKVIYMRLNPNYWLPIKRIEITETKPRYYPLGVSEGTRLCMKNVHLSKDWKLKGYEYGLPFPHPKNAIELVWDETITSRNFNPNLWFEPITFLNYNRHRKLDTKIKALLGMLKVQGRYKMKDRPKAMPFDEHHCIKYFSGRGLLSVGKLVITYPADSKGMAFLRFRYLDPEKPDLFISFLPGLRRIRVLSGSDAQDPILGSELIWDNWTAAWQKQPTKNPKLFPNKYKILGKRVILQPTYPQHPSLRVEGEQVYQKWEKRPVWVLEIDSLDPTYIYSKRIWYIDMVHFKNLFVEYYDRRGHLFRTWEDFKYLEPDGVSTWEGCDIPNYVTKRHTILKMNSVPWPYQDPSSYSIKWLNRMAR